MDYYRARSGHKLWTDQGPDLLRTPASTRAAVRGMIRDERHLVTRYEKRDGTMTDWSKATRGEVIGRLGRWMTGTGGTFQVGTGGKAEVDLVAAVRYERVPLVDLPHCSPVTSRVWSLIHHQFPRVILSGAFLYRQIDGSTEWSDHAWGTAIDASPSGITNDVLFEWCVRMAKERCVDVDYILGSLGGDVKSASAPDFDIRPSGAAVSHTWHVHTSVVDHDGARPPRNPMYR